MRLPTEMCIVSLDGGNHLIMNVHSGRNEIGHAKLRVEGPTGLKFYIEGATVLTESSSFLHSELFSAPDTICRGQVMVRVSGRH